MPSIVKLEYTRRDGMSFYDIGPVDPQEIVITAEDMPEEEALREAVAPFFDVPTPHILEDFIRSEEHTSELQSLMRISYAVFCLKKKNNTVNIDITTPNITPKLI